MTAKLTISLLLTCAAFLTTGCATPERIEVEPRAAFCDIEEPRRFTQEELDVRSERWPANLRRDFKTNTAWDREECDLARQEGDDGEE